jgi:hypothetical protein
MSGWIVTQRSIKRGLREQILFNICHKTFIFIFRAQKVSKLLPRMNTFGKNALVNIISLLILNSGLSGCLAIPHQEEIDPPKHTYKVITPGSSQEHTSIIEGGHKVLETLLLYVPGSDNYYANIIAIDDIKIGDYQNIMTKEELTVTLGSFWRDMWKLRVPHMDAVHYLEESINSYKTEISPGHHSLLALYIKDESAPSRHVCFVAELDFTIEQGKKYIIRPTIFDNIYIHDTTSNIKTPFSDHINIDSGESLFEVHVPCEKLEEYRNEFISRYKQKIGSLIQ